MLIQQCVCVCTCAWALFFIEARSPVSMSAPYMCKAKAQDATCLLEDEDDRLPCSLREGTLTRCPRLLY
eukprot:3603760-Rhodomonas_salina.4